MPVREALGRLVTEGLVVTHPYRGAVVAGLSIDEIREIFLMRQLLEGEAALIGAQRIQPQELANLKSHTEEMRQFVDDHDQWLIADLAFHMTLYRASGHLRLARVIEGLRRDIERYVRLYIKLDRNIPLSMKRHQEILTACQAQDANTVKAATIRHLRETAEMFTAELKRTTVGYSSR